MHRISPFAGAQKKPDLLPLLPELSADLSALLQSKGSLLIITHSTKILEALPVDYTHIMVNGKIVKTSDSSLIEEVNENGFAAYESAE